MSVKPVVGQAVLCNECKAVAGQTVLWAASRLAAAHFHLHTKQQALCCISCAVFSSPQSTHFSCLYSAFFHTHSQCRIVLPQYCILPHTHSCTVLYFPSSAFFHTHSQCGIVLPQFCILPVSPSFVLINKMLCALLWAVSVKMKAQLLLCVEVINFWCQFVLGSVFTLI